MGAGRVIIHTGDGKGKTTAALGAAFRALGHGQKVCFIQFIKGKGKYGERIMAEQCKNLDWHICGKGFVFKKEKRSEDREIAKEGIALATEKIKSGKYDLVVLDEITYLTTYDFISVETLRDLISHRPPHVSIILTGRGADPLLVEIADTVSSITPVKHALQQGIKAQKGIEF